MKVQVTFIDDESLTVKEIIHGNKVIFGKESEVEVLPDSNKPESMIYFALQSLFSEEQIEAYYDNRYVYEEIESKIKEKAKNLCEDIFSKVLADNLRKCQ